MNPKAILCLALVLNLLLAGCSSTSKVYPDTDAYLKGTGFSAPREFRSGSATLQNVYDWTASLLGSEKPLMTDYFDIDHDGRGELFVSQPANAGTGGNGYFIFKQTPKGYRFLGDLWFGGLNILSPDPKGRPRLVTSSSGGGCHITLWVLDQDGFREIISRNVPCGDGAHADGRDVIMSLLFDFETGTAKAVTEETLQLVFGDPDTIEFTGSVNAGKRFDRPFGGRFIFVLNPVDTGWTICVYEKGRADDLARLTCPLRGPNATEVLGEYFRNENNTALNDTRPYLPMYDHEFFFSPEIGKTINGRSPNDVTGDDIDRVEAFGRGELSVTRSKLTPPRVNETARIRRMNFHCKLTWRTKPLEQPLPKVLDAR